MFNPYEVLLREENVELIFKDLPYPLQGYYAQCESDALIVLDRALSQAQRRCILTEELAHYFLGHTGNYFTGKYQGGLTFDKQEYDAKVWATDRLINTHELLKTIQADHQFTLYDICDRFWVTEEFMLFKMQRLVNLGLLNNFFMQNVT